MAKVIVSGVYVFFFFLRLMSFFFLLLSQTNLAQSDQTLRVTESGKVLAHKVMPYSDAITVY